MPVKKGSSNFYVVGKGKHNKFKADVIPIWLQTCKYNLGGGCNHFKYLITCRQKLCNFPNTWWIMQSECSFTLFTDIPFAVNSIGSLRQIKLDKLVIKGKKYAEIKI